MHKQEFLNALRSRLKGLPREDVEERLAFWGEMIDDRIEDFKDEWKEILAIYRFVTKEDTGNA